jgi:hypothetical protein
MQAENVLLTHFSQRYPKIPVLQSSDAPHPVSKTSLDSLPTSSSLSKDIVIAVAFDCASIPIGSMWKMSRYTSALERLFSEMVDPNEADDKEELALRAAAMGIPVESIASPSESSGAPVPPTRAPGSETPRVGASGSAEPQAKAGIKRVKTEKISQHSHSPKKKQKLNKGKGALPD